ncbi:hypothetical protein [Streptomyces sp. MI02-7b]|uniref:hypothetical protein n=1 Tax=Streptomyces sp. MI02-7b TaxID=462941 RepID=UPI0029BBA21E|nr:hypothetical protein [Streptomyces sp. MI02-7b]MDX3074597.1 hypothetical protein [Streptomyces sp. MI02-7b]
MSQAHMVLVGALAAGLPTAAVLLVVAACVIRDHWRAVRGWLVVALAIAAVIAAAAYID